MAGKPKPPRCEQCGKYAYPSRDRAVAAASGAVRKGSSRTLRIYEAHGTWHMTKQARREVA